MNFSDFKKNVIAAFFFMLAVMVSGNVNAKVNVRDAVVKIFNDHSKPDFLKPWRDGNIGSGSGSGVVLKGKRILTNAHVVNYSSYLQVQKNSDTKKYLAKVEFISHDADLAILSVDDNSFFDDIQPLSIGKLPKTLDPVEVYGYSIGGTGLSTTKGVLSRVEHRYYSHSKAYLLAGQVDAAVNPGNSGGPVVVNKKIVGIAMQIIKSSSTQNLSYFIPPSVINHFLDDISDGNYDGLVYLGFLAQPVVSEAMQKFYKLSPTQYGELVVALYTGSPASDLLKVDDVIVEVNGYKIANDSSIEFGKNRRTHYKYAFDQLHPGDKIDLKVMRDGKLLKLKLPVNTPQRNPRLLAGLQHGKLPEYYVYGGIVFSPLNRSLINAFGKRRPGQFKAQISEISTDRKHESIVSIALLNAAVNQGYKKYYGIITKVNNQEFDDFEAFISLIENNKKNYTIFEYSNKKKVVIDHNLALETENNILKKYQIGKKSHIDR